jgi:O-acetyl-ADP-ribose deacetylase (regulator of RNase III)
MKVVRGDLIKLAIEGRFDVVVHGCNCQCAMGAGMAAAVAAEFPEAVRADNMTTKGDTKKLGKITYATVRGLPRPVIIVNGYTQVHWRGTGILVDYRAVRMVMRNIKAKFPGKRIGYPKIGAGLAGGDWEIISRIIDEELDGEDHTYVEYIPSKVEAGREALNG